MIQQHLRIRVLALAAAVTIVGTLFSTIVSHMPPPLTGSPTLARHDAPKADAPQARTEVAIVPARIEVIGLRASDTADNAVVPVRPRS